MLTTRPKLISPSASPNSSKMLMSSLISLKTRVLNAMLLNNLRLSLMVKLMIYNASSRKLLRNLLVLTRRRLEFNAKSTNSTRSSTTSTRRTLISNAATANSSMTLKPSNHASNLKASPTRSLPKLKANLNPISSSCNTTLKMNVMPRTRLNLLTRSL